MLPFGSHSGLIAFAAITVILRGVANGGSSLTGLEAISNSVGAFRRPEARNGRITLRDHELRARLPGARGDLARSLVARLAVRRRAPPRSLPRWRGGCAGRTGWGSRSRDLVVIATMLILFTGGNTSFNGFPYLASFVAADSFLPRQLTRRGHRLAFSNGIIVLAVVGIALVVGTNASLTSLVALYAIGVFTGFTMAGAGMVKHHRTHHEPGWKYRQVINGFAAVLSAVVVLIFAVFKFTEGAWLVVVLGPVLYFLLLRLHRQYTTESKELEEGAAQACEAPVLRRHVVLVFVDRLDLAAARAVQYARTLNPDELRAVHFAVDPREAAKLETEWSRLGLSRLPLDIFDCPDRRLSRAALELAAQILAQADTELSIVMPRRAFATAWQRILHDRSADRIAEAVSQLPHANATIVPFQLSSARLRTRARALLERTATRHSRPAAPVTDELTPRVSGTTPIGEARLACPGPRRRPDPLGARARRGGDGQPRVHARRPVWGDPPRLPGPPAHPRGPAGRPARRPRDGRRVAGAARDPQPHVRARRGAGGGRDPGLSAPRARSAARRAGLGAITSGVVSVAGPVLHGGRAHHRRRLREGRGRPLDPPRRPGPLRLRHGPPAAGLPPAPGGLAGRDDRRLRVQPRGPRRGGGVEGQRARRGDERGQHEHPHRPYRPRALRHRQRRRAHLRPASRDHLRTAGDTDRGHRHLDGRAHAAAPRARHGGVRLDGPVGAPRARSSASSPSPGPGRPLHGLRIGNRAKLAAVIRAGEPRLDTEELVGQEGDVLHLVAMRGAIAELESLLGPPEAPPVAEDDKGRP